MNWEAFGIVLTVSGAVGAVFAAITLLVWAGKTYGYKGGVTAAAVLALAMAVIVGLIA